MIEIAAAINTFASKPTQVDFVPPSDQLITLTFSQLRDLVTHAVGEATLPLQDRVSSLESRTVSLEEKNAALRAKISSLETIQEQEITRVCLDIAQDRRRIATLEKGRDLQNPPGEKTATRIAQIKTILKDRGPTTFGELERLLKISPRELLRITKRLNLRYFEITRRPGDARQKVLRLRTQIQ